MKRFYVILTILVLGSLCITVCDGPVGLGERIIMNGPVVSIGGPSPNRSLNETDPTVGTLFNLSGSARDELRITLMTVNLDYWHSAAQELVRMGREWKWEGTWMTRESGDAPWRPYTNADYDLADAEPGTVISPPSWLVYNRNDVIFNLPLFMNRMEKGEYFITVSAWNAAGRHDAGSTAKLKIKFNNQAPTVKITNPILLDGGGSLAEPQPPAYGAYIFDPLNRPEETSLSLRYFTNSFKDVSYQIESPVAAAVDLSFEITNQHNLDSFGEEKVVYYGWRWEEWDGDLPYRGIFTDRSGEVGDPIDTYIKAGDLIELSEDVQNTLPRGSVTPMQMVTRVRDAVDLEEYKSKGWFLYLPDSDKPYPDINFAHKVHKDADVPLNAPELASMARGSTNYNNLAYDDDGVRELQWTLYKLNDTTLEVERTAGSDVITFEGGKKEPWTFNANKSYGTGRFKIVVKVQDIFYTWGDEYHGYFSITSNATPTIITPLDSPDNLTVTFWGDNRGNFTIAGRAQIEDYDDCDGVDHGVRVNEIAIMWLKPGLGVENNFRYSDPNDAGWNAASGSADSYGNRIWKTGVTFDPATVGNGNDNFQEEWVFTQTLNYFTDLGIGIGAGKIPFNEQQFRIRVTGGEYGGVPRSSVYSFSTRGDMAAPVVEITHIVIGHGSMSTSYAMGSYNTLPSIAQGDRVMLQGTWSDDSIEAWAGLGNNRHNEYLSGPDINWDGETRKFKFDVESFTLDSNSGGNWETGWYTFTEHNTDPIIQLTASLTDIGGRPGTGSTVLVVETADPVLVRISSAHSDGYYGDNKPTVAEEPNARYLDIFLEFNKPVTFLTGGGAQALTYNNAPRMELNNGGEAFYQSGIGTSRIVFRYFVNGVVSPALSTAQAGKGGGNSPVEAGNPEGRLNVTGVNFNGFGESVWLSLSGVPAVFHKDSNNKLTVCSPSNIFSLAGQKRIIIDKTPPAITGVSTSASRERSHGRDSQIYLEVSFNKNISITGANSANTYLTLTGGNLDSLSARALYEHAKDSSTLNFLYTVPNGHDTSAYSQFLGVSNAVFGGAVTDAAGNPLPPYPAIPGSPVFLDGVVIDTKPPEAPLIFGVNSNTSYYNGSGFYIGGLEQGGGTVEYHLNHPASGEAATGWVTYAGTISGGQTGLIPLTLDGVYNIAARQYDTATTPNRSPRSQVVGPVRVDNGAILERMRSSMPDGSYSAEVPAKNRVTIDMEFRIPLTLAGAYSAGNLPPVSTANITVNTSGGSTNLARLSSAPANSKKWTFEYVIPQGAGTPPNTYLEVTAINLDGIVMNDQYGTRVNGPNGSIRLSDLAPENKFSSQKKMVILAGRPRVLNPALGGGIVFTGTQLRLEFDREIFRGNTAEKLMIRQIHDGYRIPAVLTEEKWNDVFVNREDIFTEQSDIFDYTPAYGGNGFLVPYEINLYNNWRDNYGQRYSTWWHFGNLLYQKGSNGASPQATNKLVSDTTVKRVLRYDVDPDNNSYSGQVDVSGYGTIKNTDMNLLRTTFRAAEALTFIPGDREITMQGNTLTIDLSSGGRPLPVKGARYEWVVPNGFVKDALGTANGTGAGGDANPTGKDTNLTSGNTPTGERVLFYANAAEPPVIRIDKGSDIETFRNGGVRQALQPVTTRAKINSRTPNATVTYWMRQTTDNVLRLLMGGYGGDILAGFGGVKRDQYPLPYVSNNKEVYDNSKMRPQSGTAGYTAPAGVDPAIWANSGQTWWEDMSANWGAARNYSTEFTIGSEDYADGGMIINIRARTTAPGVINTNDDYGYEAAFRSVFVYAKAQYQWVLADERRAIVFPPRNVDGATALHLLVFYNGREPDVFLDSGLDRVWIRGSNTLSGDTSILDFPLSRDLTQWRKARLLTPINIDNNNNTIYFPPYTAVYANTPTTTLTANNITWSLIQSRDFRGENLWFWVTWRINVPAFVDVFYGELPADANDPYQTPRTNLRYVNLGYIPEKEYYAVFPGRTTVHEISAAGGADHWTGAPHDRPFVGSAFTAPPRSD
jgi:hypothetical protein